MNLKSEQPTIEPYKLPNGWKWVRLGEVCEVIMGQSPPGYTYTEMPSGLPFFQGKADFGDYYPRPRIWCTQPIKIAVKGDILISVRAPVGPVNMNNLECCIGRGLAAIRCKDDAINWFIFWYLRSIEDQIVSLGSGSTFGAITRNDLISIQVPLPPLEDQRRIIAKIQELMQEVERARTACEKQLEAVKALPSAYLREVFESEEAKKWERKKLGEVCVFEYGSGLPQRDRLGGSVPVFGSNGIVGYHNVAITKGPTIIIGRKGSIGQVNYSEIPCWPIDTTYYIDSSKTNSDLIWLYWLLKSLRLDLLNRATGVPGLNREDAYNQIVPLPPLPEQKRIATYLKEKMAYVERLKVSIEKQLEAINALPQAILRKAFRGEL